jgi:ATP-binding cassette subfamily B protein
MIKELFQLAGDNKWPLIWGTVLQCIASAFEAAPYVFLYLILKSLFEGSFDVQTLPVWLGALAFCLVLQAIFLYWAYRINYIVSYRTIGELRLRLGNHIRKLPMGFFTERQVGDLNGLVSEDMFRIEPIPSWVYPKFVKALALPSAIAAFLLFVDWRLTLAALAGMPIAIAIYSGSQKLGKTIARNQKRAYIEANSRTIEYIQGIGVIKAFNQTGSRYEKLRKSLDECKRAAIAPLAQGAAAVLSFIGVLELGFVFILVVGTYLLLGGEVTVPTFLLFLVLSLRFYAPLQEFLEFSIMMRMMDVALERVTAVFNTPSLPEPACDRQLERFDIEFKQVSFSYEKQSTLQNLSFKLPERSLTALVGPSGSGKTTITNLIARFWDVGAGEILIGGVNIKDLKIDDLLSNIAMVFQDVYLFNDTILNNIKFGRKEATKEQAIEAAKAAMCHEFVDNLPDGYDTVIGEGGATLSGGEKQRIAIARAILKDAPIVLLDEATASVDPENEVLIQKAINSLVASKTLIIIAHRLSTITSADQILVIDRGHLVEQGKHEELLAKEGLYHRLWSSRQKARGWKLSSGKQVLAGS